MKLLATLGLGLNLMGSTILSGGDPILDSLQIETDGLVLDFLNNRTLVRTAGVDVESTPTDLLTYTSPSPKRILDSDGVLKYTNHNLSLNSQDLGTSWTPANSVVTTNTQVAPDGTTTGDTLTASASAAVTARVEKAHLGTTDLQPYTYYVIAKKGTHRYVYLNIGGGGTGAAGAVFDLNGGTSATETNVTGAGVLVDQSQVDLGGGWYRLKLTARYTIAGATYTQVGFASAATGNTFNAESRVTGTWVGTETFHVWGQELKIYPVKDDNTLASYILTTTAARYAIPIEYNSSAVCQGALIEEARTNLALRSEEFDNASWSNLGLTITANAAVAPDGTTTADKFIIPNNTNQHILFQSVGTGGATDTMSAYFKAAGYNYAVLRNDVGSGDVNTYFNLSNGTVTSTGAGFTATISDVGGGWYRCSITGAIDGSNFAIGASVNGTSITTAGNDTDGIYAWGAQFEAGSFPTSYIKTTTATVTRAADNITLPVASFPYSATAGYVLCKFNIIDTDQSENIWQLGGAADRFVTRNDAGNSRFYTVVSGATTGDVGTLGNLARFTNHKMAVAWAANDFAGSTNGATVGTDVSGALPTLSAPLELSGLTKYLREFKYVPRRVSNADLVLESA